MAGLDDDAIEQYARQIVIPGIGAAGQRKLLGATAVVTGDARGCAQAGLYLRAAGMTVATLPADPVDAAASFDVAVAADVRTLAGATRLALLACGRPVCWYVADEAGFTSGVHPDAPMPDTPCSRSDSPAPPAVQDAAACDAASVACAIVLGLPWRSGPFRFSV